MNLSRALSFCLILPLMSVSNLASAQGVQNIEAVPTGWRMQDYTDGAISLYFTGSTCNASQLVLPASVNGEVKQRLWSLLLTARGARLPIGIYYHANGGQCIIANFYLKESG